MSRTEQVRDSGLGAHPDTAGEEAGAPMTGEQASRLRTLAEAACEPEAYSERLTAAEAAQRIDILQAKLALFDGPPHAA